MVYGIWYMVYGVWCMVYGIWYMVYGIWCMVYGYMVYGIWCMVYGVWYMVCTANLPSDFLGMNDHFRPLGKPKKEKRNRLEAQSTQQFLCILIHHTPCTLLHPYIIHHIPYLHHMLFY
ncbi:hypothetical protein EON63_05130 [archaeon]|nr:MAG: hypothetical protein EON63_05130 [archaeon]